MMLGLLAAAAADARAAVAPARELAEVRIDLGTETALPGEEVAVTIHLLDDRGAPVDASPVVLECATGLVGPLRRIAEGVHRATFTVPTSLPRYRSALLVARAADRSSERMLLLAPGPASAVEISAPGGVVGSRAGARVLSVYVIDAFGNPADGEVRARDRDRRLPARRVASGLWSVEYEPLSAEYTQDDEIVVEAGEARASWRVHLSRSERWLAVAPWFGVAIGSASGPAAGASASAWWLAGGDELGVELDLGWWRLDDRSPVALSGGSADVARTRTYLPLTAAFGWAHRLRPRLTTSASLGAGGALVSATQRLAGQPAVTELGLAPAVTATATLGYRLGEGVAFLALRGVWIAGAGVPSAAGSSPTLLLAGGYRYDAR